MYLLCRLGPYFVYENNTYKKNLRIFVKIAEKEKKARSRSIISFQICIYYGKYLRSLKPSDINGHEIFYLNVYVYLFAAKKYISRLDKK